jgi:signal transduction histidine kinase
LTKIENNKLQLLIEDNGKGFDSTTQENDGIGLKNIQERARLAKAILSIASEVGRGTKIEVVFNC